jgi:zinc transporter 9
MELTSIARRYVAMHAMQDDNLPQALDHPSLNGFGEGGGTNQRKQNRPQMRDTVATAVGMLLPLLAQFGHVH